MTWLARSGLWKSVIRKFGSVDGSFCIIASIFKNDTKTVCLLNETTAVYRIHDGSAPNGEIRKSYDYKKGLHNRIVDVTLYVFRE